MEEERKESERKTKEDEEKKMASMRLAYQVRTGPENLYNKANSSLFPMI